MKKILLGFLLFCVSANAQERERAHVNLRPLLPPSMQFVDRILRPCPSGTTPYVSAIAASTGDLELTACQGRSVTINGVPIVGTGNVVGPASATDNAITRFDGTTGKLIQNSLAILSDVGNISTPGSVSTGTSGGVNGALALSGLTSGTVTQTVANAAGTWTFTWPTTAGTAGQFLQTNGAGVASWQTVSSGTSCSGCTANFLSKYNGTNLVNSRVTDNGTTIDANSAAGIFQAGDTAFGTNGVNLKLDDANNNALLQADGNGDVQSLNLGKNLGIGTAALCAAGTTSPNACLSIISGSGRADIQINNNVSSIQFSSAATSVGTASAPFSQSFQDATITAGGTTGAQTINKAAGSVNFAAAASSLVVTSNKVTTSSIIMCTVATNDTTLKSVQCVAAAGSFTMFANAAATAETRVNFWILNQ